MPLTGSGITIMNVQILALEGYPRTEIGHNAPRSTFEPR